MFSKLDEAIDDMENGRVLTEEELFFVIDEQRYEVTILRVLQDEQDWEYIIEQ